MIRALLVLGFRIALFALVVAAFFGVPGCWLAVKAQGLLWGLGATLLLGRFFCRSVCPLGMLQSLVHFVFHPKTHVRRVCTRLPETKAQRIVRWTVLAACVALAACGMMGVAETVVPISIFGKAVTLWWPGLAVFALVMVLAAVGQGRVWCNWVCPFGTLFNLVAKVALKKDAVGSGCGRCRRCFGDGVSRVVGVAKVSDDPKVPGDLKVLDDPKDSKDPNGVTRRETLKGVALLAVAEKLNDGGLAPVSLPGEPERGAPVLPPGAGDRRTFALRCAGCQLCVANCPGDCLKPSLSLKNFGQPVLNFQRGHCILGCVKCGEVCPEGAIRFLQREQRPHVHMGAAEWKRDLCLRVTEGENCSACVRKCPVQAIHLVQGFPVVDRERCVGCGACEHVCPARPMPAIYVKGYEMQRIVSPVSEADLLAEMKAKLDAGAAIVVARGGVIAASEEGRGLDPLLKLFDAGRLSGALVMDKVVGRAAAAILAEGGAKKVVTLLAGKGAAEILAARGISFEAAKTVELILNRDKTDGCPMEKAVSRIDEPQKMIEAIRKAKAR